MDSLRKQADELLFGEQLAERASSHGTLLAKKADDSLQASIMLTRASEVRPEHVSWAWDQRIPFGSLTIIAGEPGLGKSTIILDFCAWWTRGQAPGAAQGNPLAVVVASAEDNRAATIVPRLIAAGADLRLVHFVDLRERSGICRGVVLPDDLPVLQDRLREVEARVLVVDPLVAHLPGTVNSWRDQDIRRALGSLARMAESLGVAVVCVVHLNKAATTEVLARVSGSIGIVAAARSVFLVAHDLGGDDAGTSVLAHAKCNLAPLAFALRFQIESCEVPGPDGLLTTSRVRWLGEAPGVRAADLLARQEPKERHEIREATSWLVETLSEGPKPAAELVREAKVAGMSTMTVRRAKRNLGVVSYKGGFREGWCWKLPPSRSEHDGAEDDHHQSGDHLRAESYQETLSNAGTSEGDQVPQSDHLREGADHLRHRAEAPRAFDTQDDGRRVWILDMGKVLGWRPLALGPAHSIARGEQAWHTFGTRASEADLTTVTAALMALDSGDENESELAGQSEQR